MRNILIRILALSDLENLSALNRRSKAYWGYDPAFMAACVEELRMTPQDLSDGQAVLAESDGVLAGMAQLGTDGEDADLRKLFVDPPFIGTGIGRSLFDWCVARAKTRSHTRLLIEADPGAVPFYEHMGAQRIESTPSGSIPGRQLPLLEFRLR